MTELDHHRATKAQRQLNNAARYALLHGTEPEKRQIHAVIVAVDDGHITRPDALEALQRLRRYQQTRSQAA